MCKNTCTNECAPRTDEAEPRHHGDRFDHRQVFNCGRTQKIIRHQHIVKHQHDIINEYDVVHEHQINTFDVVREREVVNRNDMTSHRPDYCGEGCNCNRCRPRQWGSMFNRMMRRW